MLRAATSATPPSAWGGGDLSRRPRRRLSILAGSCLCLLLAAGGADGQSSGGYGSSGPPEPAVGKPPLELAGDDRAEATKLLRRFVTHAPFECLLVLRASARSPSEVLLFVCEEDDIHLPDLRGFVSSFRIGLAPTEPASIDVVHNHPEGLLIRTHSSSVTSYSERRRLLGLRSLSEPVVASQIRLMRSGALPCAVLPPSTDDLVTTLKILWLSERQKVDVNFYIPDMAGRWRLAKSDEGWAARKQIIKRFLVSDRLYGVLRGTAAPRNQLEERYSELFREYYALRNRIAQAFSEEAFERFEEGDDRGVRQEQLRAKRRLKRLHEVALKLGIVLEFEPHAEGRSRPAPPASSPPVQISARD